MKRIGFSLITILAAALAGCNSIHEPPAPAAPAAASPAPITPSAPAAQAEPNAPVALAPASVRPNCGLMPHLNAGFMNRHKGFLEIAKKGDIDLLLDG